MKNKKKLGARGSELGARKEKVGAQSSELGAKEKKLGGGSSELGASMGRLSKIFLFLVFFLAPTSDLRPPTLFAAERISPVTVQARVLKSKIRIGDEVRLILQVDHPRKYSILPPNQKLDLSPFEVKKAETVPVKKGQNRVQETFRLTLTVFQTGDLEIPPIPVHYTDESGEPGEVHSDPVPVKVLSVGKKLTDKDDVRPIKGPVSTGLFRFWTGLFSAMAALLFIFLAVKVTRRKLRERKDLESLKPPHERVKIEIQRLKNKGYLEEKNYKDFYSELSDILRRYLERRFGIEALEKTSSEIKLELEKKAFEKDLIRGILEVLSESDLVKFAKLTPDHALAGKLELGILTIVEATTPKEKGK